MGFKTLDLTLVSANDLKNVSMMGKMDVYVVVSLSGDPTSKQKTRTHTDGGTSPCWNQTLRFTFEESIAIHAAWSLVLVLKHDAFGPDKDLGEVRIPIKDLLSGFEGKKEPEFVTYQVRRSSGKGKGELKISYKISDAADPHAAKLEKSGPAPVGYPGQAGSSGGGYGYPPPPGAAYAYPAAPGYPPTQTGYPPAETGYPVQAGYGYPPQQGGPYGGYPPQQAPYGYGYPQQQGGYPQEKPKKDKHKKGGGGGFGMGMGAGLIGGAVGGLIIGEMLEDSFDCDF